MDYVLILGVVLFVIGTNSSHSMADQLHGAWTGRFTERTTWYIIGGIAVGVAGVLMAAFGGRRSRD